MYLSVLHVSQVVLTKEEAICRSFVTSLLWQEPFCHCVDVVL